LLLAGGSGVAPFRALLFALRARRHAAPVTLVLSARRPDELLFHEEWARVAAEHPWFSYLATVTRPTGVGWAGRTGRIGSGWVRALLPDPASCVVAACGPTGFVEAACAFAREAGVPADRVRRERWG
jgi:NADH oxidoreductase Hcr